MKFLYHPVSPWSINQGFGEDRGCISNADNKTVISKESNEATCPVGFRPLYSQTKGHNGLDLQAKRWQPVYAAHSGIVTEVQTEEARGLGIGIVSNEQRFFTEAGKKCHYKTRYWHFIALDVHKGERVGVGDFIGYADSTGFSSGDHLHFELKPVDILEWENGLPIYNNTLQQNGMLGAVDPVPYMENATALQMKSLIKQVAELSARIADFIADRLRRR